MDYKSLFVKLERTLDSIERSPDSAKTLRAILERLVDDFRDDLGLAGGRIYVRRSQAYVLEHEYPRPIAPRGFQIPLTYPPLVELSSRGFVLRHLSDPGVDREIEAAIGGKTFAAIGVGEGQAHVIALSLEGGSSSEHVIYVLNTIRHVINLKLRKDELEDRVAQARQIQLSLLPQSSPTLGRFDISGRTVPAEEVGGDLYDFIRVSERIVGIAVADAAGHGLPAALQARDAIIGLRMGVEERMRITATIEKLNRVVAHAGLASRFITLFYGEIEANHNLVYCNAGHPPPLLWRSGGFEELRRGGWVLGPNPDASYERGYATLDPGSVLLAYTDGVVEAEDARGRSFGVEALRTIVAEQRFRTATELVDQVFARVREFSGVATPIDDQTVVAVVHPS